MINKGTKEIKIEGLGYHFETMKDFEHSFYRNVYREAYFRVEDIIKSVSRYEKMQKRSRVVLQADFPNIITFIGARGVGKTSVMLSFMEALKDYRGENGRDRDFYTFEEKTNVIFTCLDCIDGSLMERGEDVFKTILAQMYRKFTDLELEGEIQKGSDFEFRKRELLRSLEDVYRTVCNIENMNTEQIMAGEAYMSSLQSFSSSQEVRKQFMNLIDMFTDLMKYNRYGHSDRYEDHYVVIAIDDIDLNIQNSFSMLEKIHRYCTVPNVIVLLTLDFQQMLSIVTRHYYEVVPKVNKLLQDQELYVRNLSMDYLEKVLPVNYRIYMPMMTNGVIIEKEKMNIKASILGKLYRRTGICFDSQGLKRHFYVPSSMRELTGFYLILDSMDKLQTHLTAGVRFFKKNINEEEARIEENYNILLFDLSNRMALEKLSTKEDTDFFQKIIHSDVRRAMSDVKEYFHNCFIVSDMKETSSVEEDIDIVMNSIENAEDISYGELIEIIYCLGRIQNGRHKLMVHCLLAFFSYSFTRQYIQEKITWNMHKKKNSKSLIEQIVGGCVLCRWSEGFLPKIGINLADTQETLEGALAQNINSDIRIKAMGRARSVRLSAILQVPIEIEKFNEMFGPVVRQIEFLTLFFSGFAFNEREEHRIEKNSADGTIFSAWKFKFERDMKGNIVLSYDNVREEGLFSGRADFDVLNLIHNSMYASEKLEQVENALVTAVEEWYRFDENNQNKEESLVHIRESIRKYSLKNEYEKWEKEFGGPTMPLPLWWFDFSYNVLKRVRRNVKKNNPKMVTNEDELFLYMKKLYHCILKQIEDQQNFYNSGDSYNNLKIKEQFEECPAIRMILKEKFQDSSENSSKDNQVEVKKVICKMFENLKNSESQEQDSIKDGKS